MKRNFKFLFLCAIGILSVFCIGAKEVHASTLVQTKQDGVYWTRRGGDKKYSSYAYYTYDMDGKTVYCIQPGVPVDTFNYTGAVGWINSPYSDETNRKIYLYGYYGYEYPGHKTLRYRLAAQALIWEETGGQIVEYWTEQYGYGDYINVDAEKNEILSLMSKHYLKPSFDTNNVTAVIGQEISFTDTNGVLSNFKVLDSSDYSATISGNTLKVIPKVTGNITIKLEKKYYTSDPTTIFVGTDADSQRMGLFGYSDPVKANINMTVVGGKIEITKVDNDCNCTTPQGQASLLNAVYEVYDQNNNLISTLTIGSDNKAITDYLPLGTYKIKEKKSSKGYYLDNNVYTAEVTSSDTVSVTVKEKVIKNYISILKQYNYVDGQTTFLNAEQNIVFEIYNIDGSIFTEIKTDKNGYATINLPYGVWKFHQVNTNTGYEKIYDFYVTVNEESNTEQYYNILNNKLSAYLQVFKTDSETKKVIALADTTFKILNLDTNQYVSQYVGGKVYSEFKTDSEGKFVTYLKLEAGNYMLVEVSSPKGYLINDTGYKFTIGNDTYYNYTTYGAFITVYCENTPIKGQIEITKTGEVPVIENGSFTYSKTELSNVKFNIYAREDIKSADGNYLFYEKDSLVETVSTNDKGYAISSKLPLGKYYLVEIETNDNYILDTTEYDFELTQIDNKTSIVYESYSKLNYLEKGSLLFTKSDVTTGNGIKNTKIEVYTDKDELIFSGLTDSDGNIKIENLFVGKFYIIETEASTGYKLSDEKVYFEIKENGEVVKANMTNEKIKGDFVLTKKDLSTGEVIPNALIEIYDENDNLIYSGRTDEKGNIKIEKLEYGKYYFLEKEAPEGYVLNTEKMYFEILNDGEVVKSELTNKMISGILEFTKIDFSTSDPIPNTLIEIYTENDELIYSGLTDENGKIIISDLNYGKYYIIEKQTASSDYILNTEKMYFEILEDGEVVKASMVNEKVVVDVPNTGSNYYYVLEIIGSVFIIAGIGTLIYVKKKKNK